MQLKNNRILKYFALLLFSFELIAPLFITAELEFCSAIDGKSFHGKSTSYILFTTLLSEEASNEEEREGKENTKVFFSLHTSINSFDCLSHLLGKIATVKSCHINPTLKTGQLYSQYKVFRI
jgi:hypothetical protein